MVGEEADENIFGLDHLYDEQGQIKSITPFLSALANSDDEEAQTADIDNIIRRIDSAILKVRSNSASLSNHAALLDVRLEFTGKYFNSIQHATTPEMVEMLNEEGANLLALQTRQQMESSNLNMSEKQQKVMMVLMA